MATSLCEYLNALHRRTDGSSLILSKRGSLPVFLSLGYEMDMSLTVLGKKWAMPVLLEILSGRNRFNSILGSIRGINARSLSARLNEYQRTGLIEKKENGSDPPQVRYVLTAKGEEMRDVLNEIIRFSLRWHDPHGQTFNEA